MWNLLWIHIYAYSRFLVLDSIATWWQKHVFYWSFIIGMKPEIVKKSFNLSSYLNKHTQRNPMTLLQISVVYWKLKTHSNKNLLKSNLNPEPNTGGQCGEKRCMKRAARPTISHAKTLRKQKKHELVERGAVQLQPHIKHPDRPEPVPVKQLLVLQTDGQTGENRVKAPPLFYLLGK